MLRMQPRAGCHLSPYQHQKVSVLFLLLFYLFPFRLFFFKFFFNWKRHVIYSTNKLHSSITKGLNAITFYKVQRLAKACLQLQTDFKLLFYSAEKWLISGRVKLKPEI